MSKYIVFGLFYQFRQMSLKGNLIESLVPLITIWSKELVLHRMCEIIESQMRELGGDFILQ